MLRLLVASALLASTVASTEILGLNHQSSGHIFDIILDRFENVFQNSSYLDWHVKVKKINRTRSIVGYARLKVAMGNDYKEEVKVLKKQGGEYRYLPYGSPSAPLCMMNSKDNYVYPEIAKMSDFPVDIGVECPLKAGNYTFHGLTFKLENVPKVIFPSGDYAGEVIYRNPDDLVIGIFRCYVQVVQV